MKHKPFLIGAFVLGLAFLAIGIVYLTTPAGSLPSFFPGFEDGSIHIHLKHGIASLVLAAGSFVIAWFNTGNQNRK